LNGRRPNFPVLLHNFPANEEKKDGDQADRK
jgi:hypothetical protein